MLVTKAPVYTAFAMKPVTPRAHGGPWRVYSVVVQRAVPGHTSLVRWYQCPTIGARSAVRAERGPAHTGLI
jgi:hypothetical protein